MHTVRHAHTILRRLKKQYPRTGPFITWRTSLELLIATVLSAQCTDVRVNSVTKKLFKKYRTARDYATARVSVLARDVYSTGFYKTKARYLKGIGQALRTKFNGRVPRSLSELMTLPGVSYKTAHLMMAKAFHQPTGVAVDTHVRRLAPRLGLTRHHDTQKIAHDLERVYPPRDYLDVNEHFITHGRAICKPQPRCPHCVLSDICPSVKKFYPTMKYHV